MDSHLRKIREENIKHIVWESCMVVYYMAVLLCFSHLPFRFKTSGDYSVSDTLRGESFVLNLKCFKHHAWSFYRAHLLLETHWHTPPEKMWNLSFLWQQGEASWVLVQERRPFLLSLHLQVKKHLVCLNAGVGPYLVTGTRGPRLWKQRRKLPRFHPDAAVLIWHTPRPLCSVCLPLGRAASSSCWSRSPSSPAPRLTGSPPCWGFDLCVGPFAAALPLWCSPEGAPRCAVFVPGLSLGDANTNTRTHTHTTNRAHQQADLLENIDWSPYIGSFIGEYSWTQHWCSRGRTGASCLC